MFCSRHTLSQGRLDLYTPQIRLLFFFVALCFLATVVHFSFFSFEPLKYYVRDRS